MVGYVQSNTHQSVSLRAHSQRVERIEERPHQQLVTIRKHKEGSDWCSTDSYIIETQPQMYCLYKSIEQKNSCQ